MFYRMFSNRLALLGCVLALGSSAFAASFTSSNLDDAETWNTVYVQGFRPSLNASPDLGLGGGDSVSLDQFDFFKSGFADSSSNIQLAILSTIWYDFNTPLTTGSSELVGISSNTVSSTASIATGDPISFSFGGLPLTYGSDYAALFVTDDGAGNLTPVLVSSLTENYSEASPGVFLPTTNYGSDNEFQYATSNFIKGDGFFQTFDSAGDAKFEATFSAVPEPTAGFLAATGSVLTVLTRRKRGP